MDDREYRELTKAHPDQCDTVTEKLEGALFFAKRNLAAYWRDMEEKAEARLRDAAFKSQNPWWNKFDEHDALGRHSLEPVYTAEIRDLRIALSALYTFKTEGES